MTASELQQLEEAWPTVAPWLTVPHNDADYQRLITLLNALIDHVGEDEGHSLASLMELVGELIAQYEDTHVPELT